MSNGHYPVTEINGDWVDELGLGNSACLSTNPRTRPIRRTATR
jgi:hypothetical protein